MSEQAAARMKVIPKRRVWTTAAVALLAAAGVLVAVTPASAVPRFHHFSGPAPGSISCSFSAKLSLSPPLTSSGGGTGPSRIRARLSGCTASDPSVQITTGTAVGSFSSSPVNCPGGQLKTTGAPATLEVLWRGRLGSASARFVSSSVSAGEATGSFAGPAELAFSLSGGPSTLCTRRLTRLTLTGTIALTDPPPSYGPARSVVSGGYGDYCAILTSDGVVCWGGNSNGELADGPTTGPDSCTNSCSKIPVSVGISANTLASDSSSYCAILTSAAVDCWGTNSSGDLGIGTTGGPDLCANDSPCSTSPVPVGISATSLVADGAGGYCAILTSATVDCWGDNSFGELGDGASSSGPEQCADSVCSTTPVSTGISATSLAAVNDGFCAILTSGTVDCWGDNSSGELGVGTTSGPETCGGYSGNGNLPCSTRPVSTGISATSLVGGAVNYCAVLTSGAVDCWGDNSRGELGNGSSSGPDTCLYSTPCSTTPSSTGISGTSVASNGNSSCAILTSGGVDCWGASAFGELGDGASSGPDTCMNSTPCNTTPVSTGISATSLATGFSGYCAILTSGAVDCWGDNTEGELGVGTMTGPELCSEFSESTPCSTTPVATGISAASLASDGQSVCAILDSGAAECWGSGFDGALGDGTANNSDVPVPVVGIAP